MYFSLLGHNRITCLSPMVKTYQWFHYIKFVLLICIIYKYNPVASRINCIWLIVYLCFQLYAIKVYPYSHTLQCLFRYNAARQRQFFFLLKGNTLHISISYNVELSEFMQILCCTQLLFVWTCKKKLRPLLFGGSLPHHILITRL